MQVKNIAFEEKNPLSSNPGLIQRISLDEFLDEEEINGEDKDINELEMAMKRTKSNFEAKGSLNLEAKSSYEKLNPKEGNEMVLKLLKERELYKEKLRLAKRAIQVRDGDIERMKRLGNVVGLDMSETRIHLAFMFSCPLIRRMNGKNENIMQLDYLSEINDIVRV